MLRVLVTQAEKPVKKCFLQVELTGDFGMIVKIEGVGRAEKIATDLNRTQ
jgi:hypothetical protein